MTKPIRLLLKKKKPVCKRVKREQDDVTKRLLQKKTSLIKNDKIPAEAEFDFIDVEHLAKKDTINERTAAKIVDKEAETVVNVAKRIRRTWFEACNQEKLNHDCLNQLLGCMAQGQGLSSTLLVDICARHERIFRNFALQQSEFKAFSVMDQLELLQTNLAHFVRYLFGRAVTSSTVQQQLQWLLLTEEPVFITEDISNLRKIEPDDLVTFSDLQRLYKYQVHLEVLGNPKLLLQCAGNVALICLFSITGTKLKYPKKVERYQQLAYNCTDLSQELFGLASSLEHIVVMQTLLAMEIDDSDTKKEDRAWVQRHLESIDLACDQISFGHKHVKECVMHFKGVPLSQQFLLREATVWVSRYQRVLSEHEEYHSLEEEERARLWVSGTFAAFAVTKAKNECCCNTGEEQFNLDFRNCDTTALQEILTDKGNYQQQQQTIRLKCVGFKECSQSFPMVDDNTYLHFARLCSNISSLLLTKTTFKLMIMLAMFVSTTNKHIFRRYLAALKHHLKVTSAAEEAELERKVHLALDDVAELSEILRSINLSAATDNEVT